MRSSGTVGDSCGCPCPRPGWPYYTVDAHGRRVRVPHGGLCPACVSPELAAELDRIPDPAPETTVAGQPDAPLV